MEKYGIGTHALHLEMQKLELQYINLTQLQKTDFPGIDLFSYPSWEILHEEEEYSLGVYKDKEQVIKELPPRQTVAPNPNSVILEHHLTNRKVYPLGVSVWKSREAKSGEMSLSTLLDLQQLIGFMCCINVVLPWHRTKSGETFQTSQIGSYQTMFLHLE